MRGCARAVLEASATARREVQEEIVRLVGEGAADPFRFGLDDGLGVVDQTSQVGVGDRARRPDRVAMGLAERFEARFAVGSELDRAIDEDIEARRREAMQRDVLRDRGRWRERRGRQGRGRAPSGRRLDLDPRPHLFVPFDPEEQSGAHQEGVGLVDMARPYRELAGVHRIANDDAGGATRVEPPRVLPNLGHARGRVDRQAFDVPAVLADHVRAGCPDSHEEDEALRRHRARGDNGFHVRAMSGRREKRDPVNDRERRHRSGRITAAERCIDGSDVERRVR